MASGVLGSQHNNTTLQPTVLVHELFLRFSKNSAQGWVDRQHFFAVAATAMRQILIDHARRGRRQKRGDGWQRVTLTGLPDPQRESIVDLIALDQALGDLGRLNPRQARIVELRFFAGLTVNEVGDVLQISTRTIEKEWRRARAWLGRQLSAEV